MAKDNGLNGFVRVREAAFYLDVSPNTIYRLIKSGELAAVRVGAKCTKISREVLQRYIAAKRINGD